MSWAVRMVLHMHCSLRSPCAFPPLVYGVLKTKRPGKEVSHMRSPDSHMTPTSSNAFLLFALYVPFIHVHVYCLYPHMYAYIYQYIHNTRAPTTSLSLISFLSPFRFALLPFPPTSSHFCSSLPSLTDVEGAIKDSRSLLQFPVFEVWLHKCHLDESLCVCVRERE